MEPAQTLMDGEASSDLANVGSGVRARGQEIAQKSRHRQQPLTNRYRFDQARLIVFNVADPTTHRPAGHLLRRIGREKCL
jgi:hypothetical protein